MCSPEEGYPDIKSVASIASKDVGFLFFLYTYY